MARPLVLYLITDEISSVLVRGQLGHLVGEGFDVVIATNRSAGRSRDAEIWDEEVTVEHLPFVREPAPLADLRALWATFALIRRHRPALVNASTPKAGLLGMVGAFAARVPVRVYVVRGLRFETAQGWRRRVFRWSEWVAVHTANHVVFNSVSLRGLAERSGLIRTGRGEVIGAGSGNGIDVDRFAAPPDRHAARDRFGVGGDDVVIGFVGRFTADKGIGDLLRAFVEIRRREPTTRLLLVGSFEAGDAVDPEVRSTIESDERVVVVPWLDDPEPAYVAMDVLAFPSYREGLPNVPLEAQLCGVPVVGYAATGTVDAVNDGVTGILVPTGDVAALTDALAAVVFDQGRRTTLGAAGPAWVRSRFDRRSVWAALTERYRCWIGDTP